MLDYNYFKNYYKIIKNIFNQTKNTWCSSRAMQQISFTGNLDQVAGAIMFLINEEVKETVFSQGTIKLF